MGMNIQTEGDGEDEVLSAINTTPLVDVMLVMLIIFLITIPVITKTVKLDLPKATNIATVTKPENITVAVDERGNIYWKESRVPNPQALADLIRVGCRYGAAAGNPRPWRPQRALRACGPGDSPVAQGRHPEGRLHIRAESWRPPLGSRVTPVNQTAGQRTERWECQ